MSSNLSTERILPYQAWWGLAACGVLIGIVMGLAPYHYFEITPRTHPFDYPWKLPDPTFWTRFSAWSLYALHQVGIWYLIYKAQHSNLKYVKGLHSVNVQALMLNLVFVGLHILQTKIFYDGLAQDVHEATAFGSVALMLFVILLMENDRRGLFFGKKVPFPQGVGAAARKYHGYYFSWAITYTFWYHPVEVTPGHLLGFFYMFMLFLQGSLFFTRFHINRWWTVFLEFFFVIHGTTVAYMALAGLEARWGRFLFGGLAIFLITQMHGVPFRTWQKGLITAICVAGAGWFYVLQPAKLGGLGNAIFGHYLAVAVCAGLVWLIMRPFVTGKQIDKAPVS
ncbi:MAG: hypothetical protein ACR2QG_05050 [Gammaproteobacteria bacterium]